MTESESARRQSALPIAPLLLNRWSPRAFDASELPESDVLTLLEAAHWAPSAFNSQPWRFCYALRNSSAWSTLLDLLLPFNRAWAGQASALVFVASAQSRRDETTRTIEPLSSHSFDAGAAWGFLAVQAAIMGYRTHAMLGFDRPRAELVLRLPPDHRLEAAIAIGRSGDPSHLPPKLRAREVPSLRRPLAEIAAQGAFPQ